MDLDTSASTPAVRVDAAKAYRANVLAVVNSFLVLLTNLSYAPMLVSAPNSANLVSAPVPGAATGAQPAEDVATFMRRVWGLVLGAVLPLWNNPVDLALHPKLVQSALSVLRNCTEQAGQLAVPGTAAGRAARDHVVDATRTQQLQDMGFSRPAAETALRRVGNHTALAMEWLLTHPEEVETAEAEVAEAGPAAATVPAADGDEALLASAQHCIRVHGNAQTLLDQGQMTDLPKGVMPEVGTLVTGAIHLLSLSPSSAFYLADLLRVHCGLGTAQRDAVADALLSKLGTFSALHADTQDSLLATSHLLLVLATEGATGLKEVIAEKGKEA
jgi:UBA/TS-N domain